MLGYCPIPSRPGSIYPRAAIPPMEMLDYARSTDKNQAVGAESPIYPFYHGEIYPIFRLEKDYLGLLFARAC